MDVPPSGAISKRGEARNETRRAGKDEVGFRSSDEPSALGSKAEKKPANGFSGRARGVRDVRVRPARQREPKNVLPLQEKKPLPRRALHFDL